jgi:hypothetical protein
MALISTVSPERAEGRYQGRSQYLHIWGLGIEDLRDFRQVISSKSLYPFKCNRMP